jgi:aspartokinase
MGQKESEIGQKTVAHQVEEYIDTHPITRNALQHGIVNYSALARVIQKSLGITKNFEAVLIAIRRNAEKLIKIKEHLETRVQYILTESNFEIKTKMAVLTLENDPYVLKQLGDIAKELSSERIHFQLIQGSNAITFVIEQKFLDRLKKLEKSFLKIKKDRVEITIKSPAKIEEVPGVISMIMNAFSERNINILETMSCYTDTMILINPEDLGASVKLLDKLLKS